MSANTVSASAYCAPFLLCCLVHPDMCYASQKRNEAEQAVRRAVEAAEAARMFDMSVKLTNNLVRVRL